MKLLNRLAKKSFNLVGLSLKSNRVWTNPPDIIKHQAVLPFATYSPWLSDAEFNQVYQKARTHTLVDIYRCYELWSLAKQTEDVEGDLLEVGVWRGGTGAIIAEAVKKIEEK